MFFRHWVSFLESGFPTYTTGAAANPNPPAAPTNLRVKHSGVSGGVVARYKPDRRASTNEVQTCTGDPNEESAWSQYGIFRNGKAAMGGFAPGVLLWVRVRTVGLAGVMGAWSDPAQIRVLRGGPRSGASDYSDEVVRAERSDSSHSMGFGSFVQRKAGDFRLSALLPARWAGAPAGAIFSGFYGFCFSWFHAASFIDSGR